MLDERYIYQDRAVVFLDILGFQDKLKKFQTEAESYESENESYYYSEGVKDFITTFKSVVSILHEKNMKYYLFSDNICITIDYSSDYNLLVNLLITINDLFFKFAQKGYFLRGGIDVGRFVVDDTIALGLPLAIAYKLEQDVALFPRIVLSENYRTLLNSFEQTKLIDEKSIENKSLLVKQHCEVYYVNTFFKLIGNNDIINLLRSMKSSIEINIEDSNHNEKVAIKYEWLANEFNTFIDEYTGKLVNAEADFEMEEHEIQEIKSLKITYNGN